MRLLVIFALLPFTLTAQTDQKKELLSVVDRFFAAMAERDTAALAATMTREGIFQAVFPGSDRAPRPTTHAEFISVFSEGDEKLLERYWSPQVFVGEGIGTVTAEYDFHVDGKLSHCGTDVFTFVRTSEGWKISGGVFNIKKEGCTESPLGPEE